MELTPQLLTDEIDFRVAVRGYDRHEVDDFLERVAVAVGQLQSQLTKAVGRAKTAEARVAELEAAGAGTTEAVLVDAPSTTTTDGSAGEEPEAEVVESAPIAKAPPAAPVVAEAEVGDELSRTLVMAQRAADTAIREAHDEARSIVDAANEEARRNREAADAAHAKAREEARGRLVAEIRELEATREAMRDDTVVLDRYLGTERARVRETIQVLRRLVDDPASLRAAPTPELSGVSTPAELEAPPAPSEPEPDVAEAAPDEDAPPVGVAASPDGPPADESVTVVGEDEIPEPEAEVDSSDPESDSSDPGPEPDPGVEAVVTPSANSGTKRPPKAPATARSGSASDSESLGQLFASSDAAKDWRSAGSDRGDQGPHTQPVAAARFEEESDEAFLAELRRAMNDDEPLGPSEDRS